MPVVALKKWKETGEINLNDILSIPIYQKYDLIYNQHKVTGIFYIFLY